MKKVKLLPSLPKNHVYICGDSFSYVSPESDIRMHWSTKLKTQLAKIIPNVKVYNISMPSCTNFAITLQLDQAIKDPQTFFIIVNGTEVFKTLMPTKQYKKVSKHFWKYKGILDEGYHNMLHEPFLQNTLVNGLFLGSELCDHIGRPYLPEYYAEKKLYETVGPVSLYFEKKYRDNKSYEPRFSDEMFAYAKTFFEQEFDINIQWNRDFSLLEGKLYKIIAKQIGLVFNLGGLLDEKITRLNTNVSNMISSELEPYQCDINFWTLPRVDLHQAPYYHINDDAQHRHISTEYFNRIAQYIGTKINASSTTTR